MENVLEHAAENRSRTKGRECNRGIEVSHNEEPAVYVFFSQILLIIDSIGSDSCRVRATRGAYVKHFIWKTYIKESI
jgi:hypothetical protein